MNLKEKMTAPIILGGMGLVGLVAGMVTIASAQVATSTMTPATSSTLSEKAVVDTPEPGDTPDTIQTKSDENSVGDIQDHDGEKNDRDTDSGTDAPDSGSDSERDSN